MQQAVVYVAAFTSIAFVLFVTNDLVNSSAGIEYGGKNDDGRNDVLCCVHVRIFYDRLVGKQRILLHRDVYFLFDM